MYGGYTGWTLRVAILLACVGCNEAHAEVSLPAAFIAPFLPPHPLATPSDPIEPLPLSLPLDARKVALGARLFNDARLSGDGNVACTSCHVTALGAANGAVHATLPHRPPGAINVPTVWNVAFDFRYAWNGRYKHLEAQLDFAETNAKVMAGSWAGAYAALAQDPDYARAFAQLYPQGDRGKALRDALVVYVRSLITPNGRFDQYLRHQGELSAQELRGYRRFRDYGCVSCHQGINVGGNMYQRFGVMRDYFEDRGDIKQPDLGLFNATQDERDRYVFRVPSLRNVALTAPYFHDGSAATLEDAARTMARYQLGRALGDDEAQDIAAFLRTLTGEQTRSLEAAP